MKRPAVLALGVDRSLAARLAGRFDVVPFEGGAAALAAAVARSGATLVHLQAGAGALLHAAAAKLCGAAVLCEAGDGPPSRWLAFPLVDAITVPSAAQAGAYRALLPRQLVVQIAPGIDCTPYQRLNRAPVSSDTPLRLIYLGRLARDEGLPEMVEALRMARGQGMAVRLVVAGSGPEEARLRYQVSDSGLARDVVFVGEPEPEHRARLLSQADVLVLPAYRAGVPRPLLEAMAAGVVPVASAVGGIPEVVEPKEQGVLIEPRDARAIMDGLSLLSRERQLLARMSAACRKRIASAFSLERPAAELSALYFMLAAAPRPRTALLP